MHLPKQVSVMKAIYCSLVYLYKSIFEHVRETSQSLVNSSVHCGKSLSRRIFHLNPSNFANFLTAQERQNRTLTELSCSALKEVLPAPSKIYKTTTATDIKARLKLLCHCDLSTRTDKKTTFPQNKERS